MLLAADAQPALRARCGAVGERGVARRRARTCSRAGRALSAASASSTVTQRRAGRVLDLGEPRGAARLRRASRPPRRRATGRGTRSAPSAKIGSSCSHRARRRSRRECRRRSAPRRRRARCAPPSRSMPSDCAGARSARRRPRCAASLPARGCRRCRRALPATCLRRGRARSGRRTTRSRNLLGAAVRLKRHRPPPANPTTRVSRVEVPPISVSALRSSARATSSAVVARSRACRRAA